jgi:nucleoside-diphosphate-sugar epimerase
MRILVTGASGHIGSAVVPELLEAGHDVLGLARSEAAAAAVSALGASVRRGDLEDLDGLREAAAASDGVIHLAYNHEAMAAGDFLGAVATDLAAVQALGAGLEGSGKPFVGTSGTLMLAMGGIRGRAGTEQDVIESGPRVDTENFLIGLSQRGVRSSVVRLSPLVHSDLDHHGFTPTLIGIARQRGVAGYVGDGSNRWPAVHTLDAARLYRLALESAPAGSRLHGVADEGVRFADIAAAIGRGIGVPVAASAPEDFGFMSTFVGLDNPTSNAATRSLLGWEPARPGLIEDIDAGHYFAASASAGGG